MIKVVKNRDWILDIPKTEEWFNQMHAQGYILKSANLKSGKFVFQASNPDTAYYKIAYRQGAAPNEYVSEGYEIVFRSGDYYIIKTKEESQVAPSFSKLLDKNIKRKFSIGIALFTYALIFGIFFITLFAVALVDTIAGDLETGDFIVISVVSAVFSIPIWILWAKYYRLKRINKALETLCGGPLNLSFTIPWDTILSKKEIAALKKDKRYVKKTKLAWHYAPDKIESWLEKMEAQGFNLVRMSKLGVSFFFIKGTPRKVKYHADYQKQTNPEYYIIHKENGWKLYFTGPTKRMSFSVWGKEYEDEPPAFYSDKQSLLKHAKRLTLTFSIMLIIVSVLYTAILILSIINYSGQDFLESDMFIMLLITYCVLFPVVIFEFTFFAVRTICYYFRIKKSIKNDNGKQEND